MRYPRVDRILGPSRGPRSWTRVTVGATILAVWSGGWCRGVWIPDCR
jgi:hypothetical protein